MITRMLFMLPDIWLLIQWLYSSTAALMIIHYVEIKWKSRRNDTQTYLNKLFD